jgi:hypothetical protein
MFERFTHLIPLLVWFAYPQLAQIIVFDALCIILLACFPFPLVVYAVYPCFPRETVGQQLNVCTPGYHGIEREPCSFSYFIL